MALAEEVMDEYKTSLADLNVNSKPLINMLTMLAEDHEQHAPEIVKVIEDHINKCKRERKLPSLYLIDSIMKNLEKSSYRSLFSRNIVQTFTSVFEQVEEKTRASMFKLRQTWSSVLPNATLYRIDKKISSLIDPAWPITATEPEQTSIHVNPRFLQGLGSESERSSPEVVDEPTEDPEDQERLIRQQLIEKQQELLKLREARLELELAEAAEKLKKKPAAKGHTTVTSTNDPLSLPMPSIENSLPLPEVPPKPKDPRPRPSDPRRRDPRLKKQPMSSPPSVPSSGTKCETSLPVMQSSSHSSFPPVFPHAPYSASQMPATGVPFNDPGQTVGIVHPYNGPQGHGMPYQPVASMPPHIPGQVFSGEVFIPEEVAKFSDDNDSDSSRSSFQGQNNSQLPPVQQNIRDPRHMSDFNRHRNDSRVEHHMCHHDKRRNLDRPANKHSSERQVSAQKYSQRDHRDPRHLSGRETAEKRKSKDREMHTSSKQSRETLSDSPRKSSSGQQSSKHRSVSRERESKSETKLPVSETERKKKIEESRRAETKTTQKVDEKRTQKPKERTNKERERSPFQPQKQSPKSKDLKGLGDRKHVERTDKRVESKISETATDRKGTRVTEKDNKGKASPVKTRSSKSDGRAKGIDNRVKAMVKTEKIDFDERRKPVKEAEKRLSSDRDISERASKKPKLEGVLTETYEDLNEKIARLEELNRKEKKPVIKDINTNACGEKVNAHVVPDINIKVEDMDIESEPEQAAESNVPQIDEDFSDLFGGEDEDYRPAVPKHQLPLESPSSKGWDQFKASQPEQYAYDIELKKHRQDSVIENSAIRAPEEPQDEDLRVHQPDFQRQRSGSEQEFQNPLSEFENIPKELDMEQHAEILLEASKKLKEGLITNEQHQELIKQLRDLMHIQKLQEENRRHSSEFQDPNNSQSTEGLQPQEPVFTSDVPIKTSPPRQPKQEMAEVNPVREIRSPDRPLETFKIPKKTSLEREKDDRRKELSNLYPESPLGDRYAAHEPFPGRDNQRRRGIKIEASRQGVNEREGPIQEQPWEENKEGRRPVHTDRNEGKYMHGQEVSASQQERFDAPSEHRGPRGDDFRSPPRDTYNDRMMDRQHGPPENFDSRIGPPENFDSRMGRPDGPPENFDGRLGRPDGPPENFDSRMGRPDGPPENFDSRMGRPDGPPEKFGSRMGRPDGPPENFDSRMGRPDGPPENFDSRMGRPDGPPEKFGSRMGRPDGPPEHFDSRMGRPDGPPENFDGRLGRPDGPPENFDSRMGRPDGPPEKFGSRMGRPDGPPEHFDSRMGRPDGPPENFDGRLGRLDGPPENFDRMGRPDGPPEKLDSRMGRPDGPPETFDSIIGRPAGPPENFDGRMGMGRPDGPPEKFDGRMGRPGPLQDFDGRMGRPDGPPENFDGRMGRPDGPQENFDGRMGRPDGPPENFDGRMGRPDGPPENFDGRMGRPDGPPEKFGSRMGRPDGPPENLDGRMGRPDGPPENFDGRMGRPGGPPENFDGRMGRPDGPPENFDGRMGRPGPPEDFDGRAGKPDGPTKDFDGRGSGPGNEHGRWSREVDFDRRGPSERYEPETRGPHRDRRPDNWHERPDEDIPFEERGKRNPNFERRGRNESHRRDRNEAQDMFRGSADRFSEEDDRRQGRGDWRDSRRPDNWRDQDDPKFDKRGPRDRFRDSRGPPDRIREGRKFDERVFEDTGDMPPDRREGLCDTSGRDHPGRPHDRRDGPPDDSRGPWRGDGPEKLESKPQELDESRKIKVKGPYGRPGPPSEGSKPWMPPGQQADSPRKEQRRVPGDERSRPKRRGKKGEWQEEEYEPAFDKPKPKLMSLLDPLPSRPPPGLRGIVGDGNMQGPGPRGHPRFDGPGPDDQDGPPGRFQNQVDTIIDKFGDPRFRCFAEMGPEVSEEVVIGKRNFGIKLGAPPRKIPWGKDSIEVFADPSKRGVVIDKTLMYKFGERVKDVSIKGRKEKLFYHGRPLSFWIDGQQFEVRLDAPPKSITIDGKTHKIQIDGRDMMILINKEEKGKFGGEPRFVFVDEERKEIRFDPPPRHILIDGNPCELKLNILQPCVNIKGILHGIRFDGPPRDVFINGKLYQIFTDHAVKIRVGNRFHYVALGGPCHEIIVDGKWFEMKFNEAPKEVTVGNQVLMVNIPGNPPDVKILSEIPQEPRIIPPGMVGPMGPPGMLPGPGPGPPPGPMSFPGPIGPGMPMPPRPPGMPPMPLPGGPMPPPLGPMPGPPMNIPLSSAPPLPMVGPPHMIPVTGPPILAGAPGPQPGGMPNILSTLFPPMPPTSGSGAPIDVKSLFDKLVNTGIIKQEVKQDIKPDVKPDIPNAEATKPQEHVKPKKKRVKEEKIADIPDMTEMNTNEMKSLPVGMVQRLYGGTQCTSCGERFALKDGEKSERYRQHLDWHFRQNRKGKTDMKLTTYRKWYYPLTDWLLYEEVSDSKDSEKSNFFEQQQQQQQPVEATPAKNPLTLVVPEGVSAIKCPPATGNDNEDVCNICHDVFEQYWDEELEEWHLRDAIKVNNKTYHPICFEDHTDVSEGTPSPSVLTVKEPGFVSRKSLVYDEASQEGHHASFEEERKISTSPIEPMDTAIGSESPTLASSVKTEPSDDLASSVVKTEPSDDLASSVKTEPSDELASSVKTEPSDDLASSVKTESSDNSEYVEMSEVKQEPTIEDTSLSHDQITVSVSTESASGALLVKQELPDNSDNVPESGRYSPMKPDIDIKTEPDDTAPELETDSVSSVKDEATPMESSESVIQEESETIKSEPEIDSESAINEAQKPDLDTPPDLEEDTEDMDTGSGLENEPDSQSKVNTELTTSGIYVSESNSHLAPPEGLEASEAQHSPSYSKLSNISLVIPTEPADITPEVLEIGSNASTPTQDELPSPPGEEES